MFMELYTDLPSEEVVQRLSSGQLGSVHFGPSEQDSRGLFGNWEYGVFSIKPLDDEYHQELKDVHGLPVTLKTRIWISTQPYYEGQIALYHVMSHLLRNWPGDLALLNYGETVMVQRIGGQIMMRVEQFNEDILPIFAGFDYQPLPAPK
jgi:hypothetical protein